MKRELQLCNGGPSLLTLFLQMGLVLCWVVAAGMPAWAQQTTAPASAPANAADSEAAYQQAMQEGKKALRQYFPATALLHAEAALKLKPGDPDAIQLRADAQAELRKAKGLPSTEGLYGRALQNGRAALADSFPLTALLCADEALKLKPGDAQALQLREAANAEIRKLQGLEVKPAVVVAPSEPTPTPAGQTPAPSNNVTLVQNPLPAPDAEAAPPLRERKIKVTKHEISASADYFLGQGDVTMPFGFSIGPALGAFGPSLSTNIPRAVGKPERTSNYFGATLSYSYGQAWYVDFAYAHGESSGTADVPLGTSVPSDFNIQDDWYQAYVRYTFPGLRGKRLSAYLRAGASYVDATLTDEAMIPALGLYRQTDQTTDILGNLGFGVGYNLYTTRRFRVDLQFEGEGFYGWRSQDTLEMLPQNEMGADWRTVKIDNDVYGGIGRGTVRLEYRLGRSGLFKIFLDGGIQAKATWINYDALGTFDELLWGPYVKAGVRYSF